LQDGTTPGQLLQWNGTDWEFITEADFTITSANIVNNSITAADLATNSVDKGELQADSVGESELIDGTITPAKLDVTGTFPGNILIIDAAGNPIWRAPGTALKSNITKNKSIRTVSDTVSTILSTDYTVIINSNVNKIQLPRAKSSYGKIYILKNITGGAITIDNYINDIGGNSTTITTGVTQLQSDGANWQQIN
ncbi:hypothetical protein, partial [uncultured Maribacter sp.]|uniref:hypothetical protein n=1 Tax=uncultured Maribacter sp. TaxID=431308 RepID=UPI0026119424